MSGGGVRVRTSLLKIKYLFGESIPTNNPSPLLPTYLRFRFINVPTPVRPPLYSHCLLFPLMSNLTGHPTPATKPTRACGSPNTFAFCHCVFTLPTLSFLSYIYIYNIFIVTYSVHI